ncbi:hypothetical protein [Yinghuangia sp. YIM S10712]|uniref:hypothetical protein n=1 Tax=Yinghuangia sp. YIM S10712 TaxID=3436930 RepID=UPI003F52FDC0
MAETESVATEPSETPAAEPERRATAEGTAVGSADAPEAEAVAGGANDEPASAPEAADEFAAASDRSEPGTDEPAHGPDAEPTHVDATDGGEPVDDAVRTPAREAASDPVGDEATQASEPGSEPASGTASEPASGTAEAAAPEPESTGTPASAPAHGPADAHTRRPTLPRVVLTADTPVDRAGSAIAAGRSLAEEGNYVLLAVPAEAAEVSTSATVTKNGVLRVLNVPVDADAAAEISVARADLAALAGPGLVTGLRRKLARRKLASVRSRVWQTAAADPEWSERCEAAYQPYVDAFAPTAHDKAGRTAGPEGVVVGVGPTNMAGQGYEWARAVERKLSGVRAETFSLSSGNTFGFAADRSISTDDWLSRTWQLGQLAYVLDNFTHVLAECAMPPFGRLNGPWANFDLAELDAAGIAVALAFHGSEIRDPAAQRARVPFSPFDPAHELTRALQSKVDRLAPVVRAMDVPKFVSTPDLLHDVPDATWLPVVVDPDLWATDTKPLERERPVVVHAPSSPFTKGTGLIEPVVERMHDAGLIEYRRIKGVPHAEMPALLADADIVLDQFVFGSYGVMSVQAMAAGRVTVCYLHDSVAEHLPADVPIVNADPDTLGAELERILAERDEAGRLAARGPAYVRENHDGGRSARVLADFLGVTP